MAMETERVESLILSPDIVVDQVLYAREPAKPTILAKRYRRPATSTPNGFTFILLHGLTTSKEEWEPAIAQLYALERRTSGISINEFWSIEAPAHGESAAYNEERYMKDLDKPLSVKDYYVQVVHDFLTAGPQEGAMVDFTKRDLIGLGQCMGGTALVFVPRMAPQLHFAAIILAEPAFGPQIDASIPYVRKSAYGHLCAQTVWPSRDAAMRYFQTKHPETKEWCPEGLEIHLGYGLRPHPASRFPPPFNFPDAVTVIPRPEIKMALHRAKETIGEGLAEAVELSRRVPVHVLWGEKSKFMSEALQRFVSKSLDGPGCSTQIIADAGHALSLIVPSQFATAIYRILEVRAKL